MAKRCKLTTLRSSARARILLARSQAAGNGLDKALKDSLDADVLESGEGAGLYRRTATTVALCDAVDAIAGPGSCRRHEIDLAGKLSFFDYSRRPPSPVLTEQSVERTHAEYAFLLNRCLIEGARADPYLRGMQVELEWVVQPSGTVDDIKVDPRRFREHPTASCLQSALKVFRYPPYRSRERRWLTLALQVGN